MARGMSTETYELLAPAKINLYLEVLGRRDNGYHDIRSVLVPISLYDRITIEETKGPISTKIKKTSAIGAEQLNLARAGDNLATKAAALLKRETGCPNGAQIYLEKNIPVGGGLGGGSSDAAVVLKALNELWNTGVSLEKLKEMGARLGCDVPALVQGGAVCMEGLGEKVTPIPVVNGKDGWWLAVVNPGFSVSTRDVYSRYRSSLTCEESAFNNIRFALKDGNLEKVARFLFNSLEETVFRKYPLIEILAEALKKAGATGVLLSGSGSSVFGLARDKQHAQSIIDHVQKELGSPVWSAIVRMLPDGVMVAHGPLEA
jgi:4-diphosphocytidyl-2-C-methyl-D-erythritol kinase